MNKKQGPLSWLMDLINADKKTSKSRYLVIVLCLGAAFMIAGNTLFKSNPPSTAASTINNQPANSNAVSAIGKKSSGTDDEQQQYQDVLKKALETMLGLKDLTVVVNLDSSDQQVYETNKTTQTQTTEESDKSGGSQKTENTTTNDRVVITNNGGNQVPLVVETKKPAIRGVLVVAKGAGDINVKASIVEAVTRVLGVPSFMVAVESEK